MTSKAMVLLCAMVLSAGSYFAGARSEEDLKVKKLTCREIELVDETGKPYMTAKITKIGEMNQVVVKVGADKSQFVIVSNPIGSRAQLQNCGQVRSYWATDVRKNWKDEEEPGVTEMCYFMPRRDPETLELTRQNGQVVMKEVFGIEAHDGYSPSPDRSAGNKEPKQWESWVGMRMTNGVIAGAAESPVMEVYSIAPWTPMQYSANQPYLKAGRSHFLLWGKDQPLQVNLMDGNLNDLPLAEVVIDGKTSPAWIGTGGKASPSKLNPPPPTETKK